MKNAHEMLMGACMIGDDYADQPSASSSSIRFWIC